MDDSNLRPATAEEVEHARGILDQAGGIVIWIRCGDTFPQGFVKPGKEGDFTVPALAKMLGALQLQMAAISGAAAQHSGIDPLEIRAASEGHAKSLLKSGAIHRFIKPPPEGETW